MAVGPVIHGTALEGQNRWLTVARNYSPRS
jgi:hypothetical protein